MTIVCCKMHQNKIKTTSILRLADIKLNWKLSLQCSVQVQSIQNNHLENVKTIVRKCQNNPIKKYPKHCPNLQPLTEMNSKCWIFWGIINYYFETNFKPNNEIKNHITNIFGKKNLQQFSLDNKKCLVHIIFWKLGALLLP